MKTRSRSAIFVICLFAFSFLVLTPAFAGGYTNALKGVNGIKALFSVSNGSAKMLNIVFWAVRNAYEDDAVKALPEKPQVALVFYGPAVKLLSADHSNLKGEELAELVKFQDTLKQMKKDGVKLEVCLYAAKVMGVNPATILPEIDQVGNGFISVIGYQQQGYAVVEVP